MPMTAEPTRGVAVAVARPPGGTVVWFSANAGPLPSHPMNMLRKASTNDTPAPSSAHETDHCTQTGTVVRRLAQPVCATGDQAPGQCRVPGFGPEILSFAPGVPSREDTGVAVDSADHRGACSSRSGIVRRSEGHGLQPFARLGDGLDIGHSECRSRSIPRSRCFFVRFFATSIWSPSRRSRIRRRPRLL